MSTISWGTTGNASSGLNEQPLAAMRRWGLDALIGAGNLFVDRDSAFAALVGDEAK